MRMKRAFMASLVVGIVVLSALVYRGAPQQMVTGTITEFEAGRWIAVASEQTGLRGYRIRLRETTAYEGNPDALRTGARVTIWWRSVGEGRFVADKVRVLSVAGTR